MLKNRFLKKTLTVNIHPTCVAVTIFKTTAGTQWSHVIGCAQLHNSNVALFVLIMNDR